MDNNTTIMVPSWQYTAEDFIASTAPYEELASYADNPFVHNRMVEAMSRYASGVGFRSFKSVYKEYRKTMQAAQSGGVVYAGENPTRFDGQEIELNAGEWSADENGIYRVYGGVECVACPHPILPVERLVNIDTGEEKLQLAYRKGAVWKKHIVEKRILASASKVTDLAAVGIAVNSETAKAFVRYIGDIENLNYKLIPEKKSIGRFGYIDGEGFSPYVDGLVFDGNESFRNLYATVKNHGSEQKWLETARECRSMSVTARIMLAASFASPLLSVVGALPFFVHLWGGTETGKTVALMLAASVWGDPLKGRFMQTFSATKVGQELTAAFLNQLPMCIDELQLTKNGKGQSNFDVYQLAEGVGKTRGRKSGGIEATPTWDCCFLTTGEDPIVGISSGGGAVNRVIEIECSGGDKVIYDGARISSVLKRNYGFAGKTFVARLYADADAQEAVRTEYQRFFNELNQSDTTDKQSLAAAAVLVADKLATEWIFKDGKALTVDEIRTFLASKEAVSSGARAYSWICNWVAENENHFYHDGTTPSGSVYGGYDDIYAYINPKVLRDALNDANFNYTATMSYLRSSRLIETKSDKEYTKSKRIGGGRSTGYVWLHLPVDSDDFDDYEDEIL